MPKEQTQPKLTPETETPVPEACATPSAKSYEAAIIDTYRETVLHHFVKLSTILRGQRPAVILKRSLEQARKDIIGADGEGDGEQS